MYLALHTSPPDRDRPDTELAGGNYSRVTLRAHTAGGVDWPTITSRRYWTAPTGGAEITHARTTLPDGRHQWLDLTTDPPTPCDPPDDWTDQ
jgi:hypothetical protein